MSEEPDPWGPGNPERPTLLYLFVRFLRNGLLAWGGPVAQIGMMHDELVRRDRWIDDERFRKVLALYQALPGPEANELAVYFGMTKRGRWGGLVAGLGFMLPGVILVTLLAALYVAYADTSTIIQPVLYGVRPAALGLVFVGAIRIGMASLARLEHVIIAAASFGSVLFFPGLDFVLVLLLGGVLALFFHAVQRPPMPGRPRAPLWLLPLAAFPALTATGLAALFFVSLKVGLLTFGGAYTSIPFLYEGAVVQNGWLTEQQFIDSLAIASLAPAPFIAIATFVGYEAAGVIGAVLATVVVFTPAFAFTLAGHGFFERIIGDERIHEFLLGITGAVIGLIGVSLLPLGEAALVDVVSLAVGVLAALAVASRRVPIPLVILGGAAVGFGTTLA